MEKPFEIREVESVSNSISESIGISNKRKGELAEVLAEGMIEDDSISAIMTRVSKYCKSNEEVIFAGFMIGLSQE